MNRSVGVAVARAANRRLTLCLSIPVALVVAAPAGNAQGLDLTQGGPIQITSRDGIEWRQAEQIVIAKGDARAVRGTVTVTGDRLIAWYRHKGDSAAPVPAAAPGAVPGAGQAATGVTGATDTEGNEVYRMRAEGNVHIFTATDQAWGDQATFDLDQSVLVMTGRALKLTTPNDTLTARDTLEYWSVKHLAVARGDAVVVTNDARRISADTLAAYTVAATANNPPRRDLATTRPVTGDPMTEMAGRLERVEAFNNVSVRTITDIVTGDRAVYVPDTGIAHLGGHVRISRGMNQVNGSEAVVNMKTGVATLLAGDSGRVSGLVMPNDQPGGPPGPSAGGGSGKPPPNQKTSGATP